MQWYFLRSFPFHFSQCADLGREDHRIIDAIINAAALLMYALEPPSEAAEIFLFELLSPRDYGAAGLYDLQNSGALNGVQLVVSAVTLTLFVPCIAQFAIMIRERLENRIGYWMFCFCLCLFMRYYSQSTSWISRSNPIIETVSTRSDQKGNCGAKR